MSKIRFATVWLAGYRMPYVLPRFGRMAVELAEKVDVVYSPVGCNLKTYPENVDVCLVEKEANR
ncbi:MAG UNVERIFIED_CONTAM: hypothetical protein LVR29_11380 [Microcystis novacekii LVE1205-3]|jgi:NAD-reducing hydrogenase small subunit